MSRLLIVPLHLLLAGLLYAWNGGAAAAQDAPLKLADLLDASGQLAVPKGFSGQVDARGYQLATGADGSPRLISDADWGDEFGLDRGCDGNVVAAAVGDAGEIYFGGWFNYCDEIRANNIVRYDPVADTWTPLGSAGNGTNNTVRALVFADGVLYVGGFFTEVDGGVPANYIAAWDTQSGQWSSLGQGTNGLVTALAVSPQGDLYVGGSFTEVNNGTPVLANRIARWNLATQSWAALEGAGGEGVGGQVLALSWLNGDLFVGGQFVEVNLGAPVRAQFLAIWSPLGGWSALGNQFNNGVGGIVLSLANDGADLYVGGTIGGVYQPDGSWVEARGIARWNPTSMRWTALGNPFGGPIESGSESVRAITIIGRQLYIGGQFYGHGHPMRMRSLARWDMDAQVWSSMDGVPGSGASGTVFALASVDGGLYAGGYFRHSRAQGGAVITGNVSRWEPALGTVSTVGAASGAAVHEDVSAIAFLDGDLYVGGATTVGGQIAKGIARWDGQNWDLLETDGSGTMRVTSLAVLDGELYVGGDIGTLPGSQTEPADHSVARWNPVDRSWFRFVDTGGDLGDVVTALTVFDGKLIVGGYFEYVNADPSSPETRVYADHIASWDPQLQQWSALASGTGQGLSYEVYALHAKDGYLYAGGAFTQANHGAPIDVNRIARWDGSTWSALGTDGGIGVDASIRSITSSETHLYVAGAFSHANVGAPISTNGVARWDLSAGGWSGLGNGIIRDPGEYVIAVAAVEGGVYVAGHFDEVNTPPNSVAVRNIARWDEVSESWSSPGSGIVGSRVNELAVHGNRVYAGGNFRVAGDKSSIGVAHFSVLTTVFEDSFE